MNLRGLLIEVGSKYARASKVPDISIDESTTLEVYYQALAWTSTHKEWRVFEKVLEALQVADKRVTAGAWGHHATLHAILEAVANTGRCDLMTRLLNIPQFLSRIADNDNKPLSNAVKRGHLGMVELLLSIDAVVKTADAAENRALRRAVKGGHLLILRRLLRIASVVQRATAKENRAFILATKNGDENILNCLLTIPAVYANAAGNENQGLLNAAYEGHVSVIARLLEIPEVSTQVMVGNNRALRVAVNNDQAGAVALLLSVPAVLEQELRDGKALTLAIHRGSVDVVHQFLMVPEIAAKLKSPNHSILEEAARYRRVDVVAAILYTLIASDIEHDVPSTNAEKLYGWIQKRIEPHLAVLTTETMRLLCQDQDVDVLASLPHKILKWMNRKVEANTETFTNRNNGSLRISIVDPHGIEARMPPASPLTFAFASLNARSPSPSTGGSATLSQTQTSAHTSSQTSAHTSETESEITASPERRAPVTIKS